MAPDQCTILIIEDDFGIRDAMTQILEDEGYAVIGVEHGLAALEVLRSLPQRPQLIMLDLTLPRLSGREFLRTYRSDPLLEHIPVIIMSADSTALHLEEFPGAIDVLPKPIELMTLLDVVGQYCSI